jgi:hypothetical protein
MGLYQDLLVELLEKIKQTQGEKKMKQIYEEMREQGKEAMSKELIVKILKTLPSQERQKFLALHPEIK